MISYAQNFEDVLLARALRGVEAGFYVDVGANDPVEDSVTKHFHEAGWRGINIEPSPVVFERLKQDRPRDVNLDCVAGASDGEAVFYEAATRGWSTSDPKLGASYVERDIARPVNMRMLKLDTILAEHGVETIHFLKIDVEGAEGEVLAGLDLARHRPWILLVEAVDPVSHESVAGSWEKRILDARYRRVFFDGLNLYYLANEHEDLALAFSRPVSVLDDYVSHALVQTRIDLAATEQRFREADSWKTALSAEVLAIHDSPSWKMTAPFRTVANFLGWPQIAGQLWPPMESPGK